jgi:hypothetical protein
MLNVLRSLLLAGLAFFRTRRQLVIEILALRRQLGVLRRSVKRSRLTDADRGLWVLLSRRWAGWSDALIIVKPVELQRAGRSGESVGLLSCWCRVSRERDRGPFGQMGELLFPDRLDIFSAL